MEENSITIYCQPEIVLPSLTEVKTFVWDNYSPADVHQEGFWEARSVWIEHFERGGGRVDFEISREALTIVKVSSFGYKFAARAAYYLALTTGGVPQLTIDNSFIQRDELIPHFGEKFDLEKSLLGIEKLHSRLPVYFERNMPFLWNYVAPPVRSFQLVNRKRLNITSTHRTEKIRDWTGKGCEGYTTFATAADVPDDFWACVLCEYTSQEWVFVLWKREGGRKFWFGSPIFHLYGEDRNTANTVGYLQKALEAWEQDSGRDVVFMEQDRLKPPVETGLYS